MSRCPAEPRAVVVCLVLLALPVAWTCAPAAAQDTAAARLLAEAEHLGRDDPEGAVETYRLVVAQFPDDRAAPRALLELARLARRLRQPERTDQALRKLVDDYGRSPEAAAAYLMRGQIMRRVARTVEELEDARATLRRVPLLFGRDRYPELAERAWARLASAEISALLGDRERAAADFLAVLEDEPPGPAAARAQLGFGRLLLDDDWRAAAQVLQASVDAGNDTEAGSDAGPELDTDPDPATDSAADAGVAPPARALLSLIHRRLIRPAAGQAYFERGAPFATALTLDDPSGVAAGADGRLVVTDPGEPAIVVLEADGTVFVRAAVRGLSRPFFDRPEGRVTALDDDGLVRPFGGRSQRLRAPDKDGPLKNLQAAVAGPLGALYAVARSESALLRYRDDDAGGRPEVMLEAGRGDLVDLAADGRGRVYVLDRKQGTVLRFGLGGPEATVARGDWKRAEAVAVDELGFVFVLDRGLRQIHLFDPAGNALTVLGPELGPGLELRAPVDIAVDGGGRLVIADAKLPHLVVLE